MDSSRFIFRAWDGIRFYGPIIGSMGLIYRSDRDYEDGNHVTDPVMQYVGLKDKNGKEIYEGDIVKPSSKYYENKFTVAFLQCEYALLDSKEGYMKMSYVLEYNGDTLTVIGNQYENPELLEEKE